MSDMEMEKERTAAGDVEGGSTVENSEKEEDMSLEGISLKEKRENDGRDSKEEPPQKKMKLGDEETKEEGVLGEAAVVVVGNGGATLTGEDAKAAMIIMICSVKASVESFTRAETDDEDGEEGAKKSVVGNSPDGDQSPITPTMRSRIQVLLDNRYGIDRSNTMRSRIEEQLDKCGSRIEKFLDKLDYARGKKEREYEMARLSRELELLRRQLEQETLLRTDLENQLKDKTRCHEQEVTEIKTRQSLEIQEVYGRLQQEYELKLQQSIQQLRANKDELDGSSLL